MVGASLQEVKAIIKSLVVSFPNPRELDITHLNRDYRLSEGHAIPFASLGYRSLEEFLRAINDTVLVHGSGINALISNVVSDKTKHISQMVQEQKKSSRKGKNRARIHIRHRSQDRSPHYISNHRTQRSLNFYAGREQLRQVVSLPPTRVLYQPESQNARVTKCGVIESNYTPNRHVHPMSYMPCSQADHPTPYKPSSQPHPATYVSNAYAIPPTYTHRVCRPPSSTHSSSCTNFLECDSSFECRSSPLRPIKVQTPTQRQTATTTTATEKQENCAQEKLDNILPTEQTDTPPASLTNLAINDKAATASLGHQYRKASSTEYLEEFLRDLSVISPKPGSKHVQHILLDDVDVPNSVAEQRPKSEPEEISNLELLLKELQMPCGNYPPIGQANSRQQTHSEVNMKKVVTFQSTAKDEEQKVPLVSPLAAEVFQDGLDTEQAVREAIPSFALNSLVYAIDFPEETLKPGEKIPPARLPQGIVTGSREVVFICEIHSPYKFWFQFHKEEHELDVLMNDMEYFYKDLTGSRMYCMASAFIAPGQICAALFNGFWHRAEILQPASQNHTRVFYVDYGTVAEVNVQDIKYLPSHFGRLPAQALRGCLSHVKPIGQHWSPEATKYLLALVEQVPIHASISDIDEANRIFHMVLCDANRDRVMQINKSLVERSFAVYDAEWEPGNIERRGQRLQHLRERFPTFAELEHGEYPTFTEIVTMLLNGIDFEQITDRRLYHPGNVDMCEQAPPHLRHLPFSLLSTNPFINEICRAGICTTVTS